MKKFLVSKLGIESGNLLQYSYLENFMDRGAWRAKSQTGLGILAYVSICLQLLLGVELNLELSHQES